MQITSDQSIAGLTQRGVPEHAAKGVAMNFADESRLDTGLQGTQACVGPVALVSLSGPAPVVWALEQYAADKPKSVNADTPLYDCMHENAGPEASEWSQVLAAPTDKDAAFAFLTKWERSAAEHQASRTAKYTRRERPITSVRLWGRLCTQSPPSITRQD